ncbi:MAG TPA: hypothetical protein VGI45_10640 [Terracidiphilus sp.]|jgi:hypothetical protein
MGKLCCHCGVSLIDIEEFCGASGARQNGPASLTPNQPPPAVRIAPTFLGQPPWKPNTAVELESLFEELP